MIGALVSGAASIAWTALFYVMVLRHVWPWDLAGRRRELKIKQRDRRW